MKTETVLMLGCKVGTLLSLQTAPWGRPLPAPSRDQHEGVLEQGLF